MRALHTYTTLPASACHTPYQPTNKSKAGGRAQISVCEKGGEKSKLGVKEVLYKLKREKRAIKSRRKEKGKRQAHGPRNRHRQGRQIQQPRYQAQSRP
jgi:hypothetical protein